ncbi:hypothetical protein [Coraliomargarita sinensis]|nr:hypothetical protein [Coraliomargarita sinensis]
MAFSRGVSGSGTAGDDEINATTAIGCWVNGGELDASETYIMSP